MLVHRAFAVALLLTASVGGCLSEPAAGPSPRGEDGFTPPEAGGSGAEGCPRVSLRVDPEEGFRPGERAKLMVIVENCGNATIAPRLPYCYVPGALEVTLSVEGATWHLQGGAASATPVDGACESVERSIAPNESFEIPFSWNGKLARGDPPEETWAPTGAHAIEVAVVSGSGSVWRAAGEMRLLPPRLPPYENDGDVTFLLAPSYTVGEEVAVRVRNDGDVPYRYLVYYAACDLDYFDSAGYPFLVPEGTHCDLANDATIAPGETVTLFEWGLDRCVVDNWGCAESEALAPGEYHVAATFHEDVERWWERPEATTRAGATFRIVAPDA